MAFSADELRVLRRALAEALQHASAASAGPVPVREPDGGHSYLRLTLALDEAVRENARLTAFVLADLARYRAALPGAALGYLARLAEALDAGHLPVPQDLAALRTLAALPCGPREAARRARLLRRCGELVEAARRTAGRSRLLALPGGRSADTPSAGVVDPLPGPPRDPEPERRVPTPAELWPPRRREAPPAGSRHRATG